MAEQLYFKLTCHPFGAQDEKQKFYKELNKAELLILC